MDGRLPRGFKRSSAIDREMRRELRRRLCVAGGVRMVLHRNSTRSFEPHPDRPRHVRSRSDRVLAQNSAEETDSLNLQCIIEWLLQNVRDRDVEIDPPVTVFSL
jgi:hypothetical protein